MHFMLPFGFHIRDLPPTYDSLALQKKRFVDAINYSHLC